MSDQGQDSDDIPTVPGRVLWHEGMMLAAPHFQQHALGTEIAMSATIRAVTPYAFGLTGLTLVAEDLENAGLVRIKTVSALFPDGLWYQYPAEGQTTLQLDVSASDLDLRSEAAHVHLCIPEHTDLAAAPGALRRFAPPSGTDLKATKDENGEGEAVVVHRLFPVATLVLSRAATDRPLDRHHSLPIARIKDEDGTLVYQPFQPPVLRVTKDQAIWHVANETASSLRERARSLSGHIHFAKKEGRPFNDELSRYRAIMASLLTLELHIADGVAHPYTLFQALVTTAGSVAGLTVQEEPPHAARYNHRDALGCFEAMRDLIRASVPQIAGSFVIKDLHKHEETGIFAHVDDAHPIADPVYVLADPRPGETETDTRSWLASAIITRSDRVEQSRVNRTPGAQRKLVNAAPEFGYIAPAGVLLARIELDNDDLPAGSEMVLADPTGTHSRGFPQRIRLLRLRHGDDAD